MSTSSANVSRTIGTKRRFIPEVGDLKPLLGGPKKTRWGEPKVGMDNAKSGSKICAAPLDIAPDRETPISALSELKDQLMCALCLDLLDEPKTLNCAHTFCKECIGRVVSKAVGEARWGFGEEVFGNSFSTPIPNPQGFRGFGAGGYRGASGRRLGRDQTINCPLCRERISVPEGGFKTNAMIKAMVSKLREVEVPKRDEMITCSDCRKPVEKCDAFICSDATHQQSCSSSGTSANERSQQQPQIVLCALCVVNKHRDHLTRTFIKLVDGEDRQMAVERLDVIRTAIDEKLRAAFDGIMGALIDELKASIPTTMLDSIKEVILDEEKLRFWPQLEEQMLGADAVEAQIDQIVTKLKNEDVLSQLLGPMLAQLGGGGNCSERPGGRSATNTKNLEAKSNSTTSCEVGSVFTYPTHQLTSHNRTSATPNLTFQGHERQQSPVNLTEGSSQAVNDGEAANVTPQYSPTASPQYSPASPTLSPASPLAFSPASPPYSQSITRLSSPDYGDSPASPGTYSPGITNSYSSTLAPPTQVMRSRYRDAGSPRYTPRTRHWGIPPSPPPPHFQPLASSTATPPLRSLLRFCPHNPYESSQTSSSAHASTIGAPGRMAGGTSNNNTRGHSGGQQNSSSRSRHYNTRSHTSRFS